MASKGYIHCTCRINLRNWKYCFALIESLMNPAIQTVAEHHTVSTDRWCKYLNGYVTVQHYSFGKPSFLDPRSSIIKTRDSIFASRNSECSSFEMQGSSLEFWASSVNLHVLLSGTVNEELFQYYHRHSTVRLMILWKELCTPPHLNVEPASNGMYTAKDEYNYVPWGWSLHTQLQKAILQLWIEVRLKVA